MPLNNRINTYAHISTALTCLSDVRLSELLQQAKPLHSGMGGASALLTIDDTSIFVKKVRLTDLERQPQHCMSTANLFELPLFYQYGIGSAGFGAWRELVAHIMTTNWVLTRDCSSFPLLYHWRVLPMIQPEPMDAEQVENLEHHVKYWDNAPPVRKWLEALHHASAYIVLFLEYVPQTLSQWLGGQLKEGSNAVESAILFVDHALKKTNNFMNVCGFLHFDGHFENILTDGELIYLSDFGLALSSQFDLTKSERACFDTHHCYDRCAMIVNLLHCVSTHLFGKDKWKIVLQERVTGSELPSTFKPLIKKYAPVALVMDKFYTSLQKESKSTPYPATQLECLLAGIETEEEVKK